MSDDKIYDHLVSRTLTREASTLAILIVTASASLILIPLFCNNGVENNWLFGIFGISFPIIGLLYRQVTYWTIQKDDYEEIRNRIGNDKDKRIIKNEHGKILRTILFFGFAISPVIFWIIIIIEDFKC